MILLPAITLVALKDKIIWVIKIYALGWRMILCRPEGGNSSFASPLCELHCGWIPAWSLGLTFCGGGGVSLKEHIFVAVGNKLGKRLNKPKLFTQRRTIWRDHKGEGWSQDVCFCLWEIWVLNWVLFFLKFILN